MNFKYFIILGLVLMSFCSCVNYKNIPYFQNSELFNGSKDSLRYDITIKPKDQLTIFVFLPIDKEAAALFNLREPRAIDNPEEELKMGTRIHRYLVDNEGNIDYPVIGKVCLKGLTITQINSHITELIRPYFQKGTDYVVNTYLDNYEVSVLGEVKTPNTFTVTRPQINVLEALAMAGDLTIYGKRNNVKILRELEDGTYEVHELDLRDTNILNSPYYYLQQRDIVYVEPNETMAQNAKIGRTTQLWVNGATIIISLGLLLYQVLN